MLVLDVFAVLFDMYPFAFQHFYHALTAMKRPQGRGLELARKHIDSCLSELDSILKSSEFLCSNACGTCEDGLEDRTTASGCQPIGFDASLNCRLSAPTPPRAIKILSWIKVSAWNPKSISLSSSNNCSWPLVGFWYLTWKLKIKCILGFLCQAVEYFQKLLHDLDILCSYSLDPLLEGVLRFVVEFQKFQPDLVARAHLQVGFAEKLTSPFYSLSFSSSLRVLFFIVAYTTRLSVLFVSAARMVFWMYIYLFILGLKSCQLNSYVLWNPFLAYLDMKVQYSSREYWYSIWMPKYGTLPIP